MSRVFDALRRVGRGTSLPPNVMPQVDVDAAVETFRIDDIPVVRAQVAAESPIVFHTDPHCAAAERYRTVRLRFQAIARQSNVKTILITSPAPREGKSTFAVNLASALAERKDRVLLLEADLRCPSLCSALGLKLDSGLTQCERTDRGWQSAIWKVDPLGFYILPGGNPTDRPTEILNSEWFTRTKQKLTSLFDWIIIDSPPVIPVSDTLALKERVDAVFVIARADNTPRTAIDETIRLLGRDRIVGVILNGLKKLDSDNRYYGRYYAAASKKNR